MLLVSSLGPWLRLIDATHIGWPPKPPLRPNDDYARTLFDMRRAVPLTVDQVKLQRQIWTMWHAFEVQRGFRLDLYNASWWLSMVPITTSTAESAFGTTRIRARTGVCH